MLGAIFITGIAAGMIIATVITMAVRKIEEAREEETRLWLEAKQRRDKLRQQMNAPRDDMSRNICEEARKGLQRREEG